MSNTESEHPFGRNWEQVGRAAEHFARRVARDAREFASRIEDHVGDFVRQMRDDRHDRGERPWRSHRHRHHHRYDPSFGARASADVKDVFEEVRGIVGVVLDELDDLISAVFPDKREQRGERDDGWTRVVANRDATCGACGATVAAGSEAHVRRTAEGAQFRCLACGEPAAASA
ncbi:MAG TPA: hypothetical protein VFD92_10300 [Candidatus Binatia bacterium]|nr:hypothetical protein [Candidatus Binatia bacterium]